MLLKNAVVLNESFVFSKLNVRIKHSIIAEVGEPCGGKEIDLNGMYLIPGLIDTHIHGANGAEAASGTKESLETMSAFAAVKGVTTFAPTIGAVGLSDTYRAIEAITDSSMHGGAKIGGIHLEGPFISEKYKGAMAQENIQKPSVEIFKSFLEKGNIKIITISPELDGAKEVIRFAVSEGVTVSIGHTSSSFAEMHKAYKWGARNITHAFNAIRPLHHREPGPLGFAFVNDNIVCEVICDLIHLHPAILKIIFKLKGSDKINLISDSNSSAGLEDGEYIIDGQTRYVKDGVVRLGDGTIAGASKTMLEGIKNLVSIGLPLEDAVKVATINPAKTLGIDAATGSIKKGKLADLAVLDKNLDVKYTFVNGKCVYKAGNGRLI